MPKEPLTDTDGEVRELTAQDFAAARPVTEFPEVMAALGLEAGQTRLRVELDLDREVVDHFRALGPAWRAHMASALARTAREEHRV